MGLSLLLYAVSIHTAAATSDKATTLLVGRSIGNGNLLLHGWVLPPGNYWTSDAAIYAGLIRLVGLRQGLLYAEPAMVGAAALVVGAVLAARGRATAAAVAAIATVSILLVGAVPALALWYVGNGFHMVAALYALVAFGLLARRGFGWRWVTATALLAFGILGDLELAAFACAPLVAVGVLESVGERRWLAGVDVVASAGLAVVIGEAVSRLARSAGGFVPGHSLPRAHHHQVLVNVVHVFTYGAQLLGIENGKFGTGGEPSVLLGLHAIGGVLVVACIFCALVRTVVRLVSRGSSTTSDVIEEMLFLATLSSIAPFVLLAGPNGIGIHFLSIPTVLAMILSGCVVGRLVPMVRPNLRAVAAGLAIAAAAVYLAGLGDVLSSPTPVEPASTLASWLESHGLTNGMGGYWAAAITTVDSGGKVTVRPLSVSRDGTVEGMSTQSADDWYAGQHFQFFASDTAASGSSDSAAAIRTWGVPAHTYVVGGYHVLVWRVTVETVRSSLR